VGGWSAENTFSKRLGRGEPLESLRVCVMDGLEQLGSDGRHLVLCRHSEEGRECREIWDLIPFGKSAGRVSEPIHRPAGRSAYRRYIVLRSVAKSVAVSEDRMRGQPLGDSAASKLVRENIRRRAGECRNRMPVWTRNSVFPHSTSTFPSSKLKVSCGTAAVGSLMGNSSSEVSGMVVSMGGSSSEASAIVKSDRVAMLMDGE
jgi:hypothetical protein